jgi:hypothetical protein
MRGRHLFWLPALAFVVCVVPVLSFAVLFVVLTVLGGSSAFFAMAGGTGIVATGAGLAAVASFAFARWQGARRGEALVIAFLAVAASIVAQGAAFSGVH